jgi:RNA polymerase sigma factor, sigma-70 family
MTVSILDVKSEADLIFAAKNGDENALRLLLLKYEPFIRACSGFSGGAGAEPDDLMQEGRMGFLSAIKNFRPDAGSSFRTFAHICIKRQILSVARRAASQKNAPMNGYIPLDEVVGTEIAGSASQNPEDVVILRERLLAVKTAINGVFTPFERRLFSLYLGGLPYRAIAKEMQVGPKKVDNTLQQIKRKLGLLFD